MRLVGRLDIVRRKLTTAIADAGGPARAPRTGWSLGVVVVVAFAVTTGGLTAAQADSHTPGGDGYTAPAPTKSDASGTVDDAYYIPTNFRHPVKGFGGYYVNGQAQDGGWHAVPNGMSSVTITTGWDSGTWTFDYTTTDFGPQAPNSAHAEVADGCGGTSGKRREVRLFLTNTDDASNKPLRNIDVYVDRYISEMYGTWAPDISFVADGETALSHLGPYHELWPGTYTAGFRLGSATGPDVYTGPAVAKVRFVVPACPGQPIPEGDPAHPRQVGAKPTVTFRQPGPRTVRMTVRNPHKSIRAKYTVNTSLSRACNPKCYLAPGAARIFKYQLPARGNSVISVSYQAKDGESYKVVKRTFRR